MFDRILGNIKFPIKFYGVAKIISQRRFYYIIKIIY